MEKIIDSLVRNDIDVNVHLNQDPWNVSCSILALQSQLKVEDRPMTQQGLGGMKTGVKGMGS
jgi:hypothetical protein